MCLVKSEEQSNLLFFLPAFSSLSTLHFKTLHFFPLLMKRLKSNTLYDGKFIFRVDRIALEDGLEIDLPMVDHPGSVVLVPILEDKVLMIKQFRPVYGDTILELPAGTLEWGEDAMEGAQRELREETGYRAETFTLLSAMLPSVGSSNEVMSILLATGLSWDPLPQDEDERIELAPMGMAKLVELALSGKLIDAKSVVGVLQAQHHLAL